MLQSGGSPQGARTKASVWFDANNGRMSTAPFADAEPWLVKFPAAAEHAEVCVIEKLYAQLADEADIVMDWSDDLVPELLLAYWFVTQSMRGTLDAALEEQLQRLGSQFRVH